MIGKLRHAAAIERTRSALRAKVIRAVEEAVYPWHAAQIEQLHEENSRLKRELLDETRAELRAEADRVIEFCRKVEIRARRDMFAAGEREAVSESEHLVRQQMQHARPCEHPHQTLEYGLSLATGAGMALEFGVYRGTTLGLIAAARDGRGVYGFDSFNGLPEHWRAGFPAGAFDTDAPPEVPGAELVIGSFEQALPGFLADHSGVVDFLHIDCDLYSSTRTVLDLVGSRLVPGSILVFDEYFNFAGWRDHEYRAWQEYAQRTGTEFSYVAYTHDNEQVVVRITAVGLDRTSSPTSAG